ncbi:hypothetical protein KC999_03390 [Proteus mirabilis]|uniref:Uncharacterized protein n=1 Tax=Providencia stuartii TaxID=588 RepID=A0ABD5LAW9_PROST|nr:MULTISPECIES: hypothetical protein [Morganellaceae]EKU0464543.1 hypothetical protein [Proteus mirabilis]EKU7559423.1 hypothetical protein [Proteus mirabilis]ELA7752282.1 hypothetical protein [Proteus mirabilis]MBU3053272.1 hypothetical protein [Proteus mirabilis]MCT7283117.1 hypothetical protein [Proteus mirabilis]
MVWAHKGSDEQAFTTTQNVRFWHKATIRRSGTFSESGGTINLQHVVLNGCN